MDIENGSNRQIRELKATLIRRVKFTAQSLNILDHAWGTNIVESRHWLVAISNTPIQPGNSSLWAPPPLHIPNTGPSITNCQIIRFGYVLRVEAVIFGATNLIIEFDIFLGNVLDTSLSYEPMQSVSTVYSSSIITEMPEMLHHVYLDNFW